MNDEKQGSVSYMNRKINKIAMATYLLGIFSLIIVILTDSAYPDTIFQVLVPVGIILIFVSAGLFVLDWVLHIRTEVKQKKYLNAFILVLLGIAVAVFFWWRVQWYDKRI